MRILIVNNDVFFLNSLQNVFEILGYHVITSLTSLNVKKIFLQHEPDVVILDVYMEDKDGFELIKELRSYCKKILIVAVSMDERYLKVIKILGANLTFSKSIHPYRMANIAFSYKKDTLYNLNQVEFYHILIGYEWINMSTKTKKSGYQI